MTAARVSSLTREIKDDDVAEPLGLPNLIDKV
jgi:hypothetical protein